MKNLFRIFAVSIAAAFLAVPASAQFLGFESPQGVTQTVFTNALAPQVGSNLPNVGQTVHILNYTGASGFVQIHLEGSYDGTNYFSISDEATSAPSGQVLAVGYYPFVRPNLVVCAACGATASYSGISSSPANLFGDAYDVSQQIKKPLFNGASLGTTASKIIHSTPYGCAAGYLVFSPVGTVPATSGFLVTANNQGNSVTIANVSVLTTQTLQVFPMPSGPCGFSSLTVTYSAGGASANSFVAFYVFLPPGAAMPSSAQPAMTGNTETTAATNTAVTRTVAPTQGQRAHAFSVSARCSAGTAGLTITDGATQIYSTAATQVSTTNFDKVWTVGLAGSPNNTMTITLSTCGVGNTGTLDVQGSAF